MEGREKASVARIKVAEGKGLGLSLDHIGQVKDFSFKPNKVKPEVQRGTISSNNYVLRHSE